MIVSVTPIGDSSGTMAPIEVGRRVAAYLQGVGLDRGGRRPGRPVELPSLVGGGTVAYYADSTGIRPGYWLGDRSGEVDPVELATLIASVDTATGAAIETSVHGSRPRRNAADLGRLEGGPEWYSTEGAASVLGVAPRYLRRILSRAERAAEADTGSEQSRRRGGICQAAVEAMASDLVCRSKSRSWLIHRDAVRTLAKERNPGSTVLAYDVTFSVPKEVSVVWARGDDAVRANVLAAIDEATAAGVRYLERHALYVRVGREQREAVRYTAAGFLHLTSRALDPQLHTHILLVNRAADEQGNLRALDGRLLFMHAKTAGYLAAAELRHQLAARLGIEHGPSRRGIAPMLGVPAEVIREFSTRAREIAEATGALGVESPSARQVAAYDTRAAKEKGFDFDEVRGWWAQRMDALGFGESELHKDVLGRVAGPRVLGESERDLLFGRLLRVSGITANEARFDRRSAVQAIAEEAGERCSGEAIESLADRFLALDQVVRLETSRDTSAARVIRRGDGRVVVVRLGESFSTRQMLDLERRAMDLYLQGLGAGAGVVPSEVLEEVLANERFSRLSEEQRRFVTELTTSGQRVQAAVGRAGSGKTTSLEAAVAAWQAAGYRVLGSAVGGTQSVLLGEEATGEARTVASVLGRYFDYADASSIDESTVLLVDEASLVSTRDVALLEQAVGEHPGAILRLVGDEEQHSSVAAGGFFRWVVETDPEHVPQLRTIYRQQGEAMEEVRLALDEYRGGMIAEALDRLERDGRVAEAASPNEAYDLLACAWYAERQRRLDDPGRKVSSMTAEHHRERVELNRRARALLQADGTLRGLELHVAGMCFQVNDEVMARAGDQQLRAEGAGRDQWVRNGSRGVVREVAEHHLVVEFERWGAVRVPSSYIEREVVPGVVGGLTHSYALTTFAVQGATMAAVMPLLTDSSSREGTYVALTRPQLELSAIAIRYDKLAPSDRDHPLPTVRSELSDLEATAATLERDRRERLSTQLDSNASGVNTLVGRLHLAEIAEALAAAGPDLALLERVMSARTRLVHLRGILDPSPDVVASLGQRPIERSGRRRWDAAAGAIAVYRERHRVEATAYLGPDWPLGARPAHDTAAKDYDRSIILIAAASKSEPPSRSPADGAFEPSGLPASGGLSDEQLARLLRSQRLLRDEQLARIRHLDRGLELGRQLRNETASSGRSLEVSEHSLERLQRDRATAETEYRRLGDDLLDIEREAADRGISGDVGAAMRRGSQRQLDTNPPLALGVEPRHLEIDR